MDLYPLILRLFFFYSKFNFQFSLQWGKAGHCILLMESLTSKIRGFSKNPMNCVLSPSLPGILQSLIPQTIMCAASHLSKSPQLHQFQIFHQVSIMPYPGHSL